MPLPIRCAPLALFVALVAPLAAQPPEPADEAKALKTAFAEEREQALKAKFPAETLSRADELAKRAEEALKADNARAAVRHFRDARWQLPYLPPGLPANVSRVLGESRLRHADWVTALAYSADGRYLASACRDFTVKVWDLGNGREVTTYRGHVDQPDDPTKAGTNPLGATDVAFQPKGKLVASVSGNQVHLWDPTTGKSAKTLLNLGKTDKPLKALAFSPDGKQIAVGGDDGILRVIETETGKQTFACPPRNARIEKVAYSPNGKLVALGDTNSQVAVYVPGATGNPLALSISGVDLGEVAGVAFTADNAAVFTCGRDGKARLTVGPKPDGESAPKTATKLRDYIGHSGPVNGLAVTADGKALVTAGDDKTVRVWDVTSAKQLRAFQGHQTKLTAVAVRPDGKQIASGSEDGGIRVWDLNTSDDHRAITDSKESLWAVAVSADGKRIAAGGADKKVRVYGGEGAKLEVELDAGTPVTALAFLPDSNKLLVAGGDKVAKVWDVTAKKVSAELAGHGLAVLAVAVTDDGKTAFTGAADNTVRAFDPATGKEQWKWPSKKAATALAVRKGGKQLAVGTADGALTVLDASGTAPKVLLAQVAHIAGVSCAAYSPDGSRLATVGGDGVLKVWAVADTGAPTLLVKFESQSATSGATGAPPLSAVAFAPDGRFVAAAGSDAVVRVWDIQTKSEVRGLRGHSDWVTAVAFGPEGRFVASVAAEKDNALRVFELPALETGSGAGGHALAVNAVAVSPNGKLAATAGTDQTIKVWDIATGKELATLVGNADLPYAIGFTANDALVMGGGTQTNDNGRLHLWGTTPARLSKSVTTGVVYTVIPARDGTKFAAWAARAGVGDVKNNAYEVYDTKGELVSTLLDKGRNVRSATFTPDLAWAVAGDDAGTLRVWDLAKKERIGGDWPLFQQAFADVGIAPGKKLLVAADSEGTVKVADVEKREVLASGKPHKSGVRALYVSPTGDTFFTLSNDRELKAWALGTGKELKELRAWAVPVNVNGATYTPDGKRVLTANADGTAYVLELP